MDLGLWLHKELQDWLLGLRESDPGLARSVGEAVSSLLAAGDSLSPPLVVPLWMVPGLQDDPSEALDLSYQQQIEALRRLRCTAAEVATSRARIEQLISDLDDSAKKIATQKNQALRAGREDKTSEAQQRETQVRSQLSRLHDQLAVLSSEEQALTEAQQRLAAKVNVFRVQKEEIKADYTASHAYEAIQAVSAELDIDAPDLGAMTDYSDAWPDSGDGPAAQNSLPDHDSTEVGAPLGVFSSQNKDTALSSLKVIDLSSATSQAISASLLFAFESDNTVVMVARLGAPHAQLRAHPEVLQVAKVRLATARAGNASMAKTPPADFTSFDRESFLDMFFPGEETEIKIGAASLIASSRAHSLADARQRMGLSQAQVAERMNVRQERVSAIERAAPGSTEVRTLAAYVRALGGNLEIAANIGDQRIRLSVERS